MDKEDVAHIHSGILSAIKKNEVLPFATTWMDLEVITLSEMSDRERQIPHNLTYMLYLKNKQTNKTKHKQSHRYREQMPGCQKGGVGE